MGPGYTIYIYPCWWEWLQGAGAVFLKLWFETTQLLRISILHFILRKTALAILDSRTEKKIVLRALNALFWYYSKLLFLVKKKERTTESSWKKKKKKSMPDSQRYRLKLYLINIAEEFIDFEKCFPVLLQQQKFTNYKWLNQRLEII